MGKLLKIKVYDLDNKEIEDLSVPDSIFDVELKTDIVAKVVNWQLSNKRQGSHKVKERSEISGSTAKIYRQKGTGRARHGSKKVAQFKGGGVVHGPRVRTHNKKIPAKIKKQAIRIILSSKLKDGNLKVVNKLESKDIKTKSIIQKINKLGISSATFVDEDNINKNFLLSIRNIKNIDFLSIKGLNAVQILKRDTLVVSLAAMKKVVENYGSE
jgi:large subunit ribosomal protein L4